MRILLSLLLLLPAQAGRAPTSPTENGAISALSFRAGAEDCGSDEQPFLQVAQFDDHSFVLRQNMCTHYEAPFLYLVFGATQALLIDTGARVRDDTGARVRDDTGARAEDFPLRATVDRLIREREQRLGVSVTRLVVAHSHGHGDHTAHDDQFRDRAGTVVVETGAANVASFFGITGWPERGAVLDLGGLQIDVLPIPGHNGDSVAYYDRKSRVLYTGDTLYPGRLYVSDFPSYRASVTRLKQFRDAHPVSVVLGAHVEMSKEQGRDFPAGSTYHPGEHGIALPSERLDDLYAALRAMGDEPRREVHRDFIIYP